MARDMNLFVDDDGTADHIHASEESAALHISQLSDDCLSFSRSNFALRRARAGSWPTHAGNGSIPHLGTKLPERRRPRRGSGVQ
jgi:hypothetical protein